MMLPLFSRKNPRFSRRGASLSLLVILVASIVIGFAGDIARPLQVHAVSNGDLSVKENQDIRVLRYFKDCLQNHLDLDGNDGNGKNKEYESWWEVFKNDSNSNEKKTGKFIIAVGTDLNPDNSMWPCEEVAKRAISIYQPSRSGDYQDYLESELWGTSITANGGPIKVDAKKVRANGDRIIARVNDAIARRESAGSTRQATLIRFAPLIEQCFKNWSNKDFDGKIEHSDDALKFPDRGVYAERQTFDWDQIKPAPGIREVFSNGLKYGKDAFLGDIKLNFMTLRPSVNQHFKDRSSDWFPIGNDLGQTVLGASYYKNHDGQTFLNCNWIKAHSDYLFSRDKQYKYYFGVQDSKLAMLDQNGNKVDIDLGTSTTETSNGSSNYQCIVAPPLSWIACPIVTLVVGAIDFLEGAIIQALEVPPLTTDGSFEGLHTAWAAFRDIANAFLVLIFLITIFAQVLPFDIDPYMVKKLLPKLIAAAIFIQFSYFFVQIMFDISRVLAQGIETLIQSIPVGDVNGGVFGQSPGNSTATSALGLLGGIAAGTAGAAAAFTAGTALIVPVLLLLLAGLISVVTLFITLQLRMIIIIIMTILAPLAFLAWILPNTESYFKKWLTGLIKLLLMYPIIVFMVTSVTLISSISYNALAAMSGSEKGVAGGASDITKVMIAIIPIVVYFMIPMTFKWAGGMFSTIAGAIQNQGGKLSAKSRAASKKALEPAKEKAATALFETSGQKGFTRFGARVASGNAFSFGESGRRKMRNTMNKNYSNVAESVQDEYQNMSNAERGEEFNKLLNSKKKGDQLKAAALGNMIAANGGGPEMAAYFDSLETGSKQDVFNEKGEKIGTKRNKVTRNLDGSVMRVDDQIWSEISKRNGAFLASAVPHSISKPISAAGASALIGSKGAGAARQLREEVDNIMKAEQEYSAIAADTSLDTATRDQAAENAAKERGKRERLANQFVSASQREDAADMHKDMVAEFKKMADDGIFDDVALNVKGAPVVHDASGNPVTIKQPVLDASGNPVTAKQPALDASGNPTYTPAGDPIMLDVPVMQDVPVRATNVAQFINETTTTGNALNRFIQG